MQTAADRGRGGGRSKITKNERTSFMDGPLGRCKMLFSLGSDFTGKIFTEETLQVGFSRSIETGHVDIDTYWVNKFLIGNISKVLSEKIFIDIMNITTSV